VPRHRGGVLPSACWPALRAVHHADAAGMSRRKLRFLRSMRLIRRPVRPSTTINIMHKAHT
jgi:hypothetical protein